MLFRLACLISLFCLQISAFGNYSGESILTILGAQAGSQEFKDFKQYWKLDKDFASPQNGIKVYVNSINSQVESFLLTGEGFLLNEKTFAGYSSALPYGILWDDDADFLQEKLCEGQKLIGRNTLKFYQEGVAIEVSFSDLYVQEISSVKFYHEIKQSPTSQAAAVREQKVPPVKAKLVEKRKQFEEIPFVIAVPKSSKETGGKYTSFKQAILDVFKAYHESSFNSIKGDMRRSKNLWNYHYTYSTKLKIPGEKFNMLYSFPFITSQLDFVSVIKESDTFDGSFESAYKSFEKKLSENFSAKDGWVSSCVPNKDSKKLSDLEFRNDKYGAIILDYAKNPDGKHVVYLRFLLFSS